MKKLELGSKIIHAGLPDKQQGSAFGQGPVFASTYHLSGNIDNADYQYARFGNPTWTALEEGIGELEGGTTVVFPSGMAAISAVLCSLLKTGQKVLLPADGYYATRAFAMEFLVQNGIEVVFVNTSDLVTYDYAGIDLVLIETPSNPLLDVADISLLAEKVHASNGILAIDNTTMTIHGQNPLALGADISISADTKALNGHSDALFGHISSTNSELAERIRLWRKLSGSVPGPMETWLVHRGLSTLDLRMERMCSNAIVIAEFLSHHNSVSNVRYPGLPSDPSYAIGKKQMAHFGFMVSFDLNTKERADCFLSNAQLVFEATSFGGIHTMAERRARWGTDDVSEGLIRLSIGCEKIEDLINDFEQALNALN